MNKDELALAVKLQSLVDAFEKLGVEMEIVDKRLVQLDRKVSRLLEIIESDGAAK